MSETLEDVNRAVSRKLTCKDVGCPCVDGKVAHWGAQVEATAGTTTFASRGLRIGKLVDEKNAAYGDSFAKSGEVLALLYPDGIRPEQYRDMLGVVRVLDKLFRIAARRDAFGESPWDDVAGYGVVAGGKEAAP